MRKPFIAGNWKMNMSRAEAEDFAAKLREDMELVLEVATKFDHELFTQGKLTPVFWGTALGNFGVDHMLDGLTSWAPSPQPRQTESREVAADEDKFSGFIFEYFPGLISS